MSHLPRWMHKEQMDYVQGLRCEPLWRMHVMWTIAVRVRDVAGVAGVLLARWVESASSLFPRSVLLLVTQMKAMP